ncbi:MAG TPA: hypothetical protein VL987_02855, partial [Cellvibrio sp.]|nr:hypothetical protein [Cellvibrio sp.]
QILTNQYTLTGEILVFHQFNSHGDPQKLLDTGIEFRISGSRRAMPKKMRIYRAAAQYLLNDFGAWFCDHHRHGCR